MAKKPTSEWGQRADAAGLAQNTLARLADVAPSSVGRGLRGEFASGVPGYLQALIVAWELMTAEQRAEWLAQRAPADLS
ncbi:hypothetical protein GBZ48_35120 [Azospirillum melinis]|uniref:Transcriptional regulator n=1 Tax=Azospirillum melinis TaxID=328839 RepID=A0ABX2KMT6_9PROT|nr:hypothetical protein [Azospirillum melinis]MBP2310459.1 hypothetical protein [Azospirillum melinis]NUB04429.1 hypothetical protein [Azospirillum melinis]